MMPAAEWDRELIAHLAAERARLRESEVMGIGGLAAAHETRPTEQSLIEKIDDFGFVLPKLSFLQSVLEYKHNARPDFTGGHGMVAMSFM